MSELLGQLPGKATDRWPLGERFVKGLSHGSMSVELYAPSGTDPQTSHSQDELYFILSGSGGIAIADEFFVFGPGDCFFVRAGVEHRFIDFSETFATWVVFWGPQDGETPPSSAHSNG